MICCLVLPKKVGKTVFVVLTLAFSVLSLSECVYYKIFDQFFWLKGIALAGEGSDYFGYAVKMISPEMIVFLVSAFVLMLITLFIWQKPNVEKKQKRILILLPVVLLIATHVGMQPWLYGDSTNEWDVWRKPRIVYKNFNDVNKSLEISGIYQFSYLNLYTGLFPKGHNLSKDDRSMADEYFTLKGEPVPNRYTGLLKGKNVIAVMLESVDTWMIDKEHTPTLYKMMNEGIHFTNYNAPFFGVGFTLSSEFAFNTGFFTPVSASSASNFSSNTFPYSLANLFKEAGYTTNSFHFNSPEFYNRGLMHKTYGYDKYNSAEDFGIIGIEAELDSNLIKNDAFYQKMVENMPFFNFFITYSSHLPYKGNSAKLELAKEYWPDFIDEEEHLEKNNAQVLAKDTDEFFRILLERLEADGLLDNTVIVAYTDHFAYGISDGDMLNEWKGETLSYCVPAFIYSKGLKAKKIDKPMMTIDWAPTLVNLFGLSKEARYLGHDALSTEGDGFVYYETGAWMDETMHYIPSEEELSDEEVVYIQKQTQKAKDTTRINDIVVLGDYYRKR
ncbi:MAG: LTA synthase family protein [Clostridia bacterium]|nr:LTA synthase family protein [Clostridia bacterium]